MKTNRFTLFILNSSIDTSLILDENYKYIFIEDKKTFRINIMLTSSEKIVHSTAIYKFSYFLIMTNFIFNPVIGDSYTNEDHRGFNLYGFALQELTKNYFSKNSRPIYALVLPENIIPQQKLPKLGFKVVRLIKYIKVKYIPMYLRIF